MIIDSFIKSLSAEQGCSAHTLRAYRHDLEEFINHIFPDIDYVLFLFIRNSCKIPSEIRVSIFVERSSDSYQIGLMAIIKKVE